jgi:RNA polymerase sigma-70 factor, ECF subfamily
LRVVANSHTCLIGEVKPGLRQSGSRSGRRTSVDVASLYADFGEGARKHLQSFGASSADLDDLVQEVFLVLHAKREQLASIRPFDPWLREVCRRVAAGERRRAHRRREVVNGEPPDTADDNSVATDTVVEESRRAEQLHHALGQLDEHERDLVALRELGDLPLEDVAELTHADRKTVSKRLGSALKRLTRLLQSAPPPAPLERSRPPLEPLRSVPAFELLIDDPLLRVGLVGSTAIGIWPGVPTVRAFELLDEAATMVLERCGGGFAYLAVVEATVRGPDLAARQKIISMMEKHSGHIRVYATALLGGGAWIARPVMTGLSLLTRPPFPMQFFNGVELAARWLAEKHPELSNASAATLIETTERLRS